MKDLFIALEVLNDGGQGTETIYVNINAVTYIESFSSFRVANKHNDEHTSIKNKVVRNSRIYFNNGDKKDTHLTPDELMKLLNA